MIYLCNCSDQSFVTVASILHNTGIEWKKLSEDPDFEVDFSDHTIIQVNASKLQKHEYSVNIDEDIYNNYLNSNDSNFVFIDIYQHLIFRNSILNSSDGEYILLDPEPFSSSLLLSEIGEYKSPVATVKHDPFTFEPIKGQNEVFLKLHKLQSISKARRYS